MVLGDLGRSGMHAFALYRWCTHVIMITLGKEDISPHSLSWSRARSGLRGLPPRLNGPRELESAKGSDSPGLRQSSRAYGLAGEAMLNLGLVSATLVFIVFGAVVGWVRRLGRTLGRRDSRQLLLPLLILFCIVLLVMDLRE